MCLVAQSCLTLCDPLDCSLSGSSIHRVFQPRILKWVVISFSRTGQNGLKQKTKSAIGLVPRGADKSFDSIPLLWWRTFTMKKYSSGGRLQKGSLLPTSLCVFASCKVTLQLLSLRDEVLFPISKFGLAS